LDQERLPILVANDGAANGAGGAQNVTRTTREVLAAARAAASAEPREVRGRLRFEYAELLDLGARYEGRFEEVCSHGC
ncbi:MAG: hypothetical protein ACYDAQ_19190, partial [Mycobacteriales bacterium]